MSELFKVVSMGRVGTSAINKFLNLHPQLSVPGYNQVIAASKKMSKDDKKFPINAVKFDNSPHIKKRGLMMHNFGSLNSEYIRVSRLKALSKLKSKSLLHVVRNPFEQTLSWMNYINQSVEISYLNWRRKVNNVEEFIRYAPTPFESLKQGQQCELFYKSGNDVRLIGFESLNAESIDETMKGCFKFLDIDESFTSDEFKRNQNNVLSNMFLVDVTMRLNGETAVFRFLPHRIVSANRTPYLAHLQDTDKVFEQAPSMMPEKGDLYLIPKTVSEFNSLSTQTRKYFFENASSIISDFVFKWAEKVEQLIQKTREDRLNELSEEDKTLLYELLKDDLKLFFSYYPEYQEKWGL